MNQFDEKILRYQQLNAIKDYQNGLISESDLMNIINNYEVPVEPKVLLPVRYSIDPVITSKELDKKAPCVVVKPDFNKAKNIEATHTEECTIVNIDIPSEEQTNDKQLIKEAA